MVRSNVYVIGNKKAFPDRVYGGAPGAAAGAVVGAAIKLISYLDASNADEGDDTEVRGKKISDWHLEQAGIDDPHRFKIEHGAVPRGHFEICACEDGSIKIAARGQCNRRGPKIITYYAWK